MSFAERKLKELDEYVKVLKGRFTLRLVILFGSFARGDWTERSDMDLLVVADELGASVGDNYVELKARGIEPLGFKTELLTSEIERPNMVVLDALQYGKVVSADGEYLKRVGEAFRRTKERLGLRWEGGRWTWSK